MLFNHLIFLYFLILHEIYETTHSIDESQKALNFLDLLIECNNALQIPTSYLNKISDNAEPNVLYTYSRLTAAQCKPRIGTKSNLNNQNDS